MVKKANEDIKQLIKNNNIKIWQVADKLGMADCNFSRKLRYKLSDSEKQRIIAAINEIKKEME